MKPRKLKPREISFCQLMARGDLIQTECYRQAGYSKKGAKDGASRIMTRPIILDEIERLRKKVASKTTTDSMWVRNRLKQVVNRAVELDDFNAVNKSLDTLNRMNGDYEKDNTQKKADVKLTMQF